MKCSIFFMSENKTFEDEKGVNYNFEELNGQKNQKHKRRYTCSLCENVSFDRESRLSNHVKKIHEGIDEGSHLCSICNSTFFEKSSLRKHIEAIHEGKRHSCSLCGSSFTGDFFLERTRKNPLRGCSLGVLTHTTAWE